MPIVVESWAAEDLDLGVGDVNKTGPSGGTLASHQVSLSTFSTVGAAGVAVTATWDPASISVGGSTSTSITVPGAAIGDKVLASLSTMVTNDIVISAHVSAANTVRVVLFNPSAAAVDLASGTLSVLVFKHR